VVASFGVTSALQGAGARRPARARSWALALGVALGAAALPAAGGAAEAIGLPSGRSVTFLDSIWGQPGPAGLTVRFRFLEPDLGVRIDAMSYDEQEADMRFLCETYALSRIANTGPQPSQVIVSIADRPTEFGAPDPEARQVFEAYRPEGETCVWEGF